MYSPCTRHQYIPPTNLGTKGGQISGLVSSTKEIRDLCMIKARDLNPVIKEKRKEKKGTTLWAQAEVMFVVQLSP